MRDRNSLSWLVIFVLLVSLGALPFASTVSAQGAAPAPDLPPSDMPPPNTFVPDWVLDITPGIIVEEGASASVSSSGEAEVAGEVVEEGAAPAPDLPPSDEAPPNTFVPEELMR